jgi:hypothetical protein
MKAFPKNHAVRILKIEQPFSLLSSLHPKAQHSYFLLSTYQKSILQKHWPVYLWFRISFSRLFDQNAVHTGKTSLKALCSIDIEAQNS